MKYSVHSCVKLAELIFRIDGAPFSSRHAEPTVLNEDTEVEVLHGPLRVESPQGEPLDQFAPPQHHARVRHGALDEHVPRYLLGRHQ